MGRTAIIIVSHNHKRFLADCLRAVERAGIAPGTARLFLVDNASTDGTADFVRTELLVPDGVATRGGFPISFIESRENLGFAGGNDLALRRAIDEGDAYAYLLNPDTEAAPGFLEHAIGAMAADASIAVVQSLLKLHPRIDRVNTWGNEIHFLGFGYAGGESMRVDDPAARPYLRLRDIAYASGAGMLIRLSALGAIGLLDEELFAYHEDLEFSWRARLAGFRIVLAPESVVFHKYEFSRSIRKWQLMERNRFLVMLWCYRLPTLLVLAPAMLAMELGLWLFAIRSGWWKEKARAYAYFLKPSTWRSVIAKRKRARALRKISDREATALFTGRILFQQMQPALLTRVANPVFEAYWRLIHSIMLW